MSGQPTGQRPDPSSGWEQSAHVEDGLPALGQQPPNPPHRHPTHHQPHAQHQGQYFQNQHGHQSTPPTPDAGYAQYLPEHGVEEPVYYEHYEPYHEYSPPLQRGHEPPQSPWVSQDQYGYYHRPPPVQGQGQYVQMNAPHPPAAAPLPAPPAQAPSPGDQMQMLLMNQMMMQQMAAQQMQVAQMAALGRGAGGSGGGGGGGCGEGSCERRKGATMINVKGRSERPRRRPKVVRVASPPTANAPAVKPIVAVVPPRANLPAPTADSSALDNWHEATIILCVAIVGLIYLVSSRGTGGDKEKKPSLAEKHLT
ncbi:hypothetical protein JCM24511_01502 [Saitozyma sp. JCM 24511]|nr:hypothetical protein JCM24511_01502 [Saitozyma sp. JCM 24511]